MTWILQELWSECALRSWYGQCSGDALKRLYMVSLEHFDVEKKELEKYVHMFSRLGVGFKDMFGGGIIVLYWF